MAMGALSALDATLALLRSGAARLAGALLELDTDGNRALLDPAARTGETAGRARAVRARLDWLWERHRLLSDVVTRAEALRGDKPWLGPRRIGELEALLHRASVPRQPPPPPTPTPDGPGAGAASAPGGDAAGPPGASPPPGVAIYPEDLLLGTAETVEAARADVAAVIAAWTRTAGELAAAERRLAELAATAAGIGLPDLPELAAARAAVRTLARAAAADPMSVPTADVTAATAAVDAADTALAVLARARVSLDDDLRAAGETLAEIVDLAARAERAARRAVERVTGARAAMVDLDDGWFDHPSRGLRPWLDRLVAAAAAGDWQLAARGLRGWHESAATARAAAARAVTTNAAPLRRRDELRGLLGALRAKATADALAGVPELETLYGQAHDALYVAPSDLDHAARLVQDYARGVTTGRAPAGAPPVAARDARARAEQEREQA
ncbi:hypothetical protein [Frankia nepalensis]|uniref:hypothetical protein n=1 Tax=Frankia nepalensis TaxID=1836974 RepID=UPI001933F03F|nr:hypothetical protein [Frankia nepalensis]MBL7495855.1 hypothetical protein [Frankia nepalensis]MBL7509931.1 hypothetical protein [Frankia nepalensis]